MTDIDPDEPRPDAISYSLVMPAVVTKDNGGELDGLAYMCGWQTGTLEAELKACHDLGATPRGHYIYPEILPQIDLIAMENGFTVERGSQVPDWQYVSFKPVDPCGGIDEV